MSSSISHKIKKRNTAKDTFITPRELAKLQIDMTDDANGECGETWLDPCRYNEEGSYYSQFPRKREWCEITEGKSFFDYEGEVDIICCNPPYSILDKWFKKCISLNPDTMSFLIGVGNLTARRIEWFNKAGYGLTDMKMLKVFGWYGMSMIVVFDKGGEDIISIDRKVWYGEKELKEREQKKIEAKKRREEKKKATRERKEQEKIQKTLDKMKKEIVFNTE